MDAAEHLRAAKAFEDRGEIAKAEHQLKCSIQSAPDDPIGYFSLGALLATTNRVSEAIPLLNHGCQLEPSLRQSVIALLQQLVSDKESECKRALEADRNDFDSLLFLGKTRFLQGKPIEGSEYLNRALAVAPGNPAAEYSLAFSELIVGDFDNGWRHYESRFGTGQRQFPRRPFIRPQWDGGDPGQNSLFVHAEQGIGDTIQFVRYIPLLQRVCSNVTLECQPQIYPLLSASLSCRVIAKGEQEPAFDMHVPLMSLPRIFRTTVNSIPRNTPYLHPFRSRFSLPHREPGLFNIGIVWAGNPALETDIERSIPLEMFGPLISVPRARLYSLQIGPARRQLQSSLCGRSILDLGTRFRDFADTAAAIGELDLIISVDTAVAHLAGALARPVWTLLPYAPEWRWLLDRTDSPWYPTMRLFRQTKPIDWPSVIDQVCIELEILLGQHG